VTRGQWQTTLATIRLDTEDPAALKSGENPDVS